jgi:hypothetical protein
VLDRAVEDLDQVVERVFAQFPRPPRLRQGLTATFDAEALKTLYSDWAWITRASAAGGKRRR